MHLILLGPPGAGKGTQAVLLSRYYKLPHISTGDILREQLKERSKLSTRLKSYVEKGRLVPDDIVDEIIKLRFEKKDIKDGFILDGYPRNLAQAKSLDKILGIIKKPIDFTIYFDASNKIIIQRLSGRRVCSVCAANFHIKNMPPKKDMICDFCSGRLYQRKDDTTPTIKRRISVYLREGRPLVNYYLKQGKLKKVCADKDAEVVFKELKDFLS